VDVGIHHRVGITPRSAEYLLHFERPYKHARHYLGFAEDLERRLELHRAGRGARLVEVVVAAGIGFQLVRTWDGDGTLERALKNRHNAPARLCPLCQAERRGDD
jgi:predicted GIY-YIG superfamily endonuclease